MELNKVVLNKSSITLQDFKFKMKKIKKIID
jgi:hypothetical protein